jgi:hypothetical protein
LPPHSPARYGGRAGTGGAGRDFDLRLRRFIATKKPIKSMSNENKFPLKKPKKLNIL